MNTLKRFSPAILLAVIMIFGAVYITGCTSAQSTTGKLAYKERDYVKAESELKKGLLIDKTDAEGWYMLGHSQVELGKYTEAEQSFKTSLSINSNYAEQIKQIWVDKYNAGVTSYNSGLSGVKKGDTATSVRAFRTALTSLFAASHIIPDSIKVYQLIGDSYFYMGKKDSALYYYTSIIDKSKSADDANQIARILYETGVDAMKEKEYARAQDVFGKIVGLQYLPKDNKYYEVSIYNTALANYRIVEQMANENKPASEYTPYLNNIITLLEPFVATTKNKDLLKDSYELLIVAYETLDMKDKLENAKRQKEALG